MAHFDAAGGFQLLGRIMEAAIPRLGGPQVRLLGQGAEIGPGGAYPMAVRLIGPADEPLQLQGGGVRQPQELMFKPWRNNRFGAGCEATTRCRGWVSGWVNSLISQVGSQVAEGDVVEAHAQLPAIDEGAIEGSHLQQPPVIGKNSGDGIGQLHLIELLVAPQADEHGLHQTVGEAGRQQQHLDDLGGVEAVGCGQGLNGGLSRCR